MSLPGGNGLSLVLTCRVFSHLFLYSRVVNNGQHVLKRADIRLKAPIHNPNKIICIGMNYVDHCTEQNYPLPKEPILFSKFNNAIADPGAPVIYPDETEVCLGCVSLLAR